MTIANFRPDVGIFASTDVVAVDQATIDLLDCADVFPGSLPENVTLRPGEGHILERIWAKDPYEQVRQAAKLGLGKVKYTLRKML